MVLIEELPAVPVSATCLLPLYLDKTLEYNST